MEVLRGQVESVRPISDGWGVLVLLHGSDRERAEVTGTVLGLREGDTVEAEGFWSTHPKYGRRLKARRLECVAPNDAAGVIEWCRGRLPAVGRKLATAMVERWPGPELWNVLGATLAEGERSPLEALRGITNARAHAIHAAYAEHLEERDRMVRLKAMGLTDGQCAAVLERYGVGAAEELRADPYALIGDVHGFGWKRADALALRLGLPLDHPSRLRAAVVHVLDEAAGQGHVYIPTAKLAAMAARLCGVTEHATRDAICAARGLGAVAFRKRGAGGADAYRADLFRAEASVAEHVRRLGGAA